MSWSEFANFEQFLRLQLSGVVPRHGLVCSQCSLYAYLVALLPYTIQESEGKGFIVA